MVNVEYVAKVQQRIKEIEHTYIGKNASIFIAYELGVLFGHSTEQIARGKIDPETYVRVRDILEKSLAKIL